MSGIEYNRVIEYWKNRASQQGKKTVGFSNQPLQQQDEQYKTRFDFIIPRIDTTLKTLDYGCGVGRYTKFFNIDNYVGVDVTKELLDIAIAENGGYKYVQLTKPDLSEINDINIEQFLSCTVLQHNSDEGVKIIFNSLQEKIGNNGINIILYENTANIVNVIGGHVNFRTVEEYNNLIKLYFDIINFQYFKHVIHNEEHSLMLFKCKNNL